MEEFNFIDLATREKMWLLTVESTKISADDFYRSHRTSALGEQSYRNYILEKLDYIKKYTKGENFGLAFKSILLGKNISYDVPIEFTRYLIKSINERFERARKLLTKNKESNEHTIK